jgi:hypothetical protein
VDASRIAAKHAPSSTPYDRDDVPKQKERMINAPRVGYCMVPDVSLIELIELEVTVSLCLCKFLCQR